MLNAFRPGSGGGGTDDTGNSPHQILPGTVSTDVEQRHRFLDYQREGSTPKHRIRWNFIVDLPVGKGKAIAGGAHGILNKMIGGWQVASLGSLRTNYFSLSSSMFSTGQPFENYGYQYPIQN